MDFFEKYYSNTVAGSGTQSFFASEPDKKYKGRIFFRIFEGGEYEYSLLYNSITDSTFADGSHSVKNTPCGPWKIHGMRLFTVKDALPDAPDRAGEGKTVLFDGKPVRTVAAGDIFNTDPVTLRAESGDYLCIETEFSGEMIPNHIESLLPAFVQNGEKWEQNIDQPFPASVGCTRPVEKKIAFIGDSITQGIGSPNNAYNFWTALTAENLGHRNGYWNLGLGYARADDAASGGYWLEKAKKAQYAFICFGVNDINQGFRTEQLKANLTRIVSELHKAGCRAFVQTVPPGYYSGDRLTMWEDVNRYILANDVLAADAVFDCVPVLRLSGEEPFIPAAGNVHPTPEYAAKWAAALLPAARKFIG